MTVADSLPLDSDAAPPGVEEQLDRSDRAALRPPWRQPLALTGGLVILAWIVIAIFAPLLAPDPPNSQFAAPLLAPTHQFVFGTDQLGRDIFSRVLYGARLSLPLAALLVAVSLAIGSLLGAMAGFFGGIVDSVIMRIADLVFAFPGIILALAVAAALGPQLRNAVLAVIVVSWPSYARLARSLVLGARTSEYVTSARLFGSSGWRVLRVELGPNVAGPLLVLATLDVGNAVLLLSGLSFLGLGAQPPTAEWGAMVSAGAQNFNSWWVGLFPGLAILTVVLAFNFIGDALRDILDPRTARMLGK
ncbi:MAG: binding-protein-dependent transport system inner rane component [Acidimicrobiaceae bacterium]|nr:binding-protein-dependent transport system inner rane component [Acidimicrobiaceae bacterium]